MTIDEFNPNQTPEDGENLFIDTRPLPEPEQARKNIAHKRIFFLLIALCVVVVGFIVWEVVDIIGGVSL